MPFFSLFLSSPLPPSSFLAIAAPGSSTFKNIPGKTKSNNTLCQGQHIAKQYTGKRLRESGGEGSHKVGTNRKKVQILGPSIQLQDNGQVIPLGWSNVSSETGEAITHYCIEVVTISGEH